MKTSLLQKTARIILGSIMTLAGIGHLTFQREEFQAQVPRWLPDNPAFMDVVVVSSGIVEIGLGLSMLFFGKRRVAVGLVLASFYVFIFPGNVSQYVNGIDGFGLDTDRKRLVRLFFQPVLILWALWSTGALAYLMNRSGKSVGDRDSFYDLEATELNGRQISLDRYRGKTVVLVNTASRCGLTPQYEGLEKLYQTYRDRGLVVLGFPCNQFGKQERGTSNEIEEFCQLNYGVSFPMFEKVDVNGANAHPVFRFVKDRLPGGIFGSAIKWNFTKFLIDKNGEPVKRFAPTTLPERLTEDIEKII